jgi:GNAT superfamily N-acetyltransferase
VTAAPILRPATSADAERVTEIFLTSRLTAMPWLAKPHTDDETRRWHANVLLPRGTVVVAERDGEVAGFADPAGGWLNALYVDPPAQGTGIGSALFTHSMALQPSGFDLWVFQRNTRALDFYARYGCVEVRRTAGKDNMEKEPDVLLHWPGGPAWLRRGAFGR